jgi:hypothetical protein
LINVASFAGEVTMAASSPLVLGLGLGLGAGGGERDGEASAATAAPKRASALTFMQQQELEHQVLIYRYFAAGAPVPVHLVLPIWKSVAASSFGPQRFPSRKLPCLLRWEKRNKLLNGETERKKINVKLSF